MICCAHFAATLAHMNAETVHLRDGLPNIEKMARRDVRRLVFPGDEALTA